MRMYEHTFFRNGEGGMQDQQKWCDWHGLDQIRKKISLFHDGHEVHTGLRTHTVIRTPATFACQFQEMDWVAGGGLG